MQIHFTTQHIELTPALKTFTEEKMARLQHRDPDVDKVNITLRIENITHIAEASLRLNHTDIHATAKSNDMYETIDVLVDKLLKQITKHKEKLTNHHHHDDNEVS
ncbi:MAG: ribosome-associated translation inhibitor RaiA [Pseudomonadota bacterium]